MEPTADEKRTDTAGGGEVEALPSGNDPTDIWVVQGWNWGAFWLTWIWAIAHRLWAVAIGMLLLVLVVPWVVVFLAEAFAPGEGYVFGFLARAAFAVVAACYLGAKGNVLAWRKRSYRDLDHFEATERVWAYSGFGFAVLFIALAIVLRIAT